MTSNFKHHFGAFQIPSDSWSFLDPCCLYHTWISA